MADVIDTSEFRNGLKILCDNEPFVIVEFQHVKPGKGSAFVRTRYKRPDTASNHSHCKIFLIHSSIVL